MPPPDSEPEPPQTFETSIDPIPPTPTHADTHTEDAADIDDDTTDFYKIVNADAEMRENAEALINPIVTDFEHEHSTVALLDVLQCLGVQVVVAANFAAALSRNRPRFRDVHARMVNAQRFVNSRTDKSPTFMEVYGRGSILGAAHGCRRNLNIWRIAGG